MQLIQPVCRLLRNRAQTVTHTASVQGQLHFQQQRPETEIRHFLPKCKIYCKRVQMHQNRGKVSEGRTKLILKSVLKRIIASLKYISKTYSCAVFIFTSKYICFSYIFLTFSLKSTFLSLLNFAHESNI